MGVRFNSQKKKIGSYISTDIFQFSLGCIFCGNKIIIVTEPATCTYQITLGARLKIETWDPETSGAIVLEDSIEKEKRESNSFAKLDHVINDINKLKNSGNHFNELFDVNERDWNDPYTNNQRLRKKFRIEQDKRNIEYNEMTSIRDKMNLSIDVLPLNEEDLKVSKELDFTRFLPKNTSGIFGGDVRNVLLKGQSLGINGDPFQIRKQDHEKQAADLNSKITDRKLVDYDSE